MCIRDSIYTGASIPAGIWGTFVTIYDKTVVKYHVTAAIGIVPVILMSSW